VDGEWTRETLKVMANVFDYVIPISKVSELAEILEAYLQGDKSKLKWLITFRIDSVQ
jgi:metal-sulfur cluster biosynthetic enzyme